MLIDARAMGFSLAEAYELNVAEYYLLLSANNLEASEAREEPEPEESNSVGDFAAKMQAAGITSDTRIKP